MRVAVVAGLLWGDLLERAGLALVVTGVVVAQQPRALPARLTEVVEVVVVVLALLLVATNLVAAQAALAS